VPGTAAGPRSAATRARLLDTAEFLFARRGIAAVTTRELVEAAGQRNASAISYHFGSRDGLLAELLVRRGGPVDARRGELRGRAGSTPPPEELVRCLVEPYAELLHDPGGRAYLRIVAQLRGRFASWRVESDRRTTEHLVGILDEIEHLPAATPARRRNRVLAMIMVITSTTAERARHLDEGRRPELGHDEFVDDLVAMCAALVAVAGDREVATPGPS
jgi:AcrR family transcriptional regulator